MKVSGKQKRKTRTKILNAAVDIITEKGFRAASMRQIAKAAKVGDATIYNYFSSKEKLLYGYCEHIQQQVMDDLKTIEDFNEFSVQEQLQQLIELQLQAWLPAREFLQQVFSRTFYSPATGITHLAETRRLNFAMVTDILDAAIDAGEIPDQPYQELLPRLFWDYQTGILAYWLKDTSDDFANTTQLIDKSMGLIANILQQGFIGKSLDLVSFLFRTHILNHLDSFTGAAETASFVKRQFMGGGDDKPRSKNQT